jgi:hypothetical protein
VALRKDLPQPVWELRLNPDYGTLPGILLLEALQGVGAVGADLPAYADRLMKLNIYVGPSSGLRALINSLTIIVAPNGAS